MSIIELPRCPRCGEPIQYDHDWMDPRPVNHDCLRGAVEVKHRTRGGKGVVARALARKR